MLTISADGYIRLTAAEFGTMNFIHLISGLDEDSPPFPDESAARTAISGYTEWLSGGEPRLSIGWDWVMDVSAGKVRFNRSSEPRSNCMLIDAQQHDLGHVASNVALGRVVDTLPWQEEVERQIATRYGQPS